jgi:hypothetical protein
MWYKYHWLCSDVVVYLFQLFFKITGTAVIFQYDFGARNNPFGGFNADFIIIQCMFRVVSMETNFTIWAYVSSPWECVAYIFIDVHSIVALFKIHNNQISISMQIIYM